MTKEVYHRGMRTEQNQPNSFEALTKSKRGDMLEMDILGLEDGELAIAHSRDLGLSLEQAEKLDTKEFSSIEKPKEKNFVKNTAMPLFQEILGIASDRDVKLVLDIKASSQQKILQMIESIGKMIIEMQQQKAFQSNPDFLQNNLFFHTLSIVGAQQLIQILKENNLDHASVSLIWPTAETYAARMEISKKDIEYAKTITHTDDWIEKGLYIAKQIGCKGIGMHAGALIKNPGYIQKAHELGLWIAGGGIEDEEVKKKLDKYGIDLYFTETLK